MRGVEWDAVMTQCACGAVLLLRTALSRARDRLYGADIDLDRLYLEAGRRKVLAVDRDLDRHVPRQQSR